VKIKGINLEKEIKFEVFETEEDKLMGFRHAKRSNASTGDILNIQSSLNQTLDQFQKKNFRRTKGQRLSIRSTSN
jgi:hypothetical protein